jgi:threonine dehydrogenase-like Zn-dependent dehydrogenase
MIALVKDGDEVQIREVAPPRVRTGSDVVVRVAAAGICRTDLFAAAGQIPTADPVVLGHEFAGIVEEVGAAVTGLMPGDRVTALPWLECGACAGCAGPAGTYLRCRQAEMLGVDRDGAFAEHVVLPAANLYRLPAGLPFRVGAYVEPVAASMAVLKAGLPAGGRGVIFGGNRIAVLTARVLQAAGYRDIWIRHPRTATPVEESAWDFAVETVPTSEALAEVVRAVRPGGTIVLKSRPAERVGLDLRNAVLKELTLRAVNYAPFPETIAWLAEGRIDLSGLLGPVLPLTEWKEAFRRSGGQEAAKAFLRCGTIPGEEE